MTKPETDILLTWLEQLEFPKPVTEFRFHPERKWRFDIAWPDQKIALEIEGGVWIQGRHVRGKGYLSDLDKYNSASVLGWMVIRIDTSRIYTNMIVDMLQIAFTLQEQRQKNVAANRRKDPEPIPCP